MKLVLEKSKVIKNISYSVFANLISLLVSVFMVMIVPKFLSVKDYGTWQLFLFYFSYLGFFHFGWEDGIYLRYAGKNYKELDEKTFSGQFYSLLIFQIILACFIVIYANLFIEDLIKKEVIYCVSTILPFVNFNNLCSFIMQLTNRIKDYAVFIFIERVILLIGVCTCIFLGLNQFENMYSAKVVSLICAFFLCATTCKNLLKPTFYSFGTIFKEIKNNIFVGIKLMLANIASLLIIGIIRFGISEGWDISTFGKVSLTLGISNFLMVFIDSVAVVLFPILKHIDEENLSNLYKNLRSILIVVVLGILLFYYPIKELLSWWLPKYSDGLNYMAVLFPICVFESKVSLLINTYLKSLRKEKLMLKINFISVVISIVTTVFTVVVMHNLDFAILSIVGLYAFRSILAEYYLGKILNLKLTKEIILELCIVSIFMGISWNINNWNCMILYGVTYLIFIGVNRKNIKDSLHLIWW